jgi:transcriptional regulator with GAF, ATPase, and Fis domain
MCQKPKLVIKEVQNIKKVFPKKENNTLEINWEIEVSHIKEEKDFITKANSGNSSEERLTKEVEEADIILLDYFLEGWQLDNGANVIKKISSLSSGKRKKIILYSTKLIASQAIKYVTNYDLIYFLPAPQDIDYKNVVESQEKWIELLKFTVAKTALEVIEQKEIDRFLSENIIGSSDASRDIKDLIERVSEVDEPVLIIGETGVGKEKIARAIHKRSKRNKKPFVAVNCSAIPDSLIESELFGYAKGAFTGATKDKKGYFQAANGGTLFLDEIGDANEFLQTKILRVLQEGVVRKVGSVKEEKVDVRVICATNKNILDPKYRTDEQTGKVFFREDLYHRISTFPIYVPPLRERKDDIDKLCEHFLNLIKKKYNKWKDVKLSDGAKKLLKSYDYPGNVRELEKILKRACILMDNNETEITQKHIYKAFKIEGIDISSTNIQNPTKSTVNFDKDKIEEEIKDFVNEIQSRSISEKTKETINSWLDEPSLENGWRYFKLHSKLDEKETKGVRSQELDKIANGDRKEKEAKLLQSMLRTERYKYNKTKLSNDIGISTKTINNRLNHLGENSNNKKS